MCTSPHQHPDALILIDFHMGRLPLGLDLVVSAHLNLCPACRREAELLDAVGGEFLDQVEGVAMSDDSVELALARTERQASGPARSPTTPEQEFLTALRLPKAFHKFRVCRRRWVAPGVWIADIDAPRTGKAEKTYLMSARGGMVMPAHSHRSTEVTLVIRGQVDDGLGLFGPGDFVVRDAEISHTPAMAGDQDCLCLVWQNASIRPSTWLGRVLQPLAGI